MVPAPTQAPMFTYDGISTTPRPRNEPQRADAPGRARTPASANPCLSGSLSAYSNGPCSIVSMPAQREQQEDGLLEPFVDDHLVGRRVDLGDAGLARVQQVDRLLDELGGVRVGRRELAAPLPQLLDLRLEISHGFTLARRSPTSSNRSIGCTTATRTWPAPPSP